MNRDPHRPGRTTRFPTWRCRRPGGRSRAAPWRGARLPAFALAVALALAGCTGGEAAKGPVGSSSGGTQDSAASAAPAAGRWWSNSAASVGSEVDPSNPVAVAAKLTPSMKDYCGMLAETMKSGRSVLTGVGAGESLTMLQAFVAEIEKVAPPEVSGAWQVLGPALVGFAATQGKSLGTSTADATQISLAAQKISANSTQVCHVDLSAPPASG